MSDCAFTVTFRGTLPDPVNVGDELMLSGRVTVRAIEADLIDVTSHGRDVKYLPGDVTIDLYSNRLEVEAA